MFDLLFDLLEIGAPRFDLSDILLGKHNGNKMIYLQI